MINNQTKKLIVITVAVVTFVFSSLLTFQHYRKKLQHESEQKEAAIQTMINDLNSSDDKLHKEAMKIAAKMGEAAVKPLIEAVKHGDRNFNREAADALMSIGESAVEPLKKTLNDEQLKARRVAAFALLKSNPDWVKSESAEEVIPDLINTFKSKDKYLREDAIDILRKIGEPAVEPLIETLDDKQWLVRESAAGALGRIKDSRAIEPLIEKLSDAQWEVRRAAAYALGKIGDSKALSPLSKLAIKDNISDVRFAATTALKRLRMLVSPQENI